MLDNIHDLLLVQDNQESKEPYYEVLEYVSFDGTQYFDTGIYGNLNTKIEAGLSVTSISSNGQLFGARNIDANKSNIGCIFVAASGSETTHITLDFNNSSYATYRMSSSAVTVDTYYDIIVSRKERTVYLDGVSKGSNTQLCSDTFASQNTITIGKVNGATGLTYGSCPSTWKYFQIYEDGVLEHDYIPVLDNRMQPCLYDRVSKTFLYAKKIADGTTTYDLGFKRWNKYDVDYIENDGDNTSFSAIQYIDTGIIPADKKISGKVKYCYLDTPVTEAIVGGTKVDNSSNLRVGTLSGKYRIKWNNQGYTGTSSITDGTIFEDEFNTSTGFYTNNTLIINAQYTSVSACTNTIKLFTDTTSGDALGYNKVAKRLYYCTFYEDDVLIRSYKPVVWNNTSTTAVACLYDEVYNKMYTNAGTSSFKAYIAPERIGYNLAMGVQNNGYYISATGVVTAQEASCYTDAIPVKQGDIITLDVTVSDATTANKRIHAYSGTSTSNWVSQLGVLAFDATSELTQTLTVTVPSGVNYIRLSHSNMRETECTLTIMTTYAVGRSITGDGTAYIDTGYAFTGNFEWEMVFNGDNVVSAGSGSTFFGGRSSSIRTAILYKIIGTNKYSCPIASFNGTGTELQLGIILGKARVREKVDVNNRTASTWVDEVAKQTNESITGSTDIISGSTQAIFGDNYGEEVYEKSNLTLFSLKMWDMNDLVRDYIPVKNATTNDVGLFDSVNKTFTGNSADSGTLTFDNLS